MTYIRIAYAPTFFNPDTARPVLSALPGALGWNTARTAPGLCRLRELLQVRLLSVLPRACEKIVLFLAFGATAIFHAPWRRCLTPEWAEFGRQAEDGGGSKSLETANF